MRLLSVNKNGRHNILSKIKTTQSIRFTNIKEFICPHEHSSLGKEQYILYARVGVRIPDTPLIHLQGEFL